MSTVEGKWKTSLLVSGLITFIAAVHYYYMRDYWAVVGEFHILPLCGLDFDCSFDVRGILPHSKGSRC